MHVTVPAQKVKGNDVLEMQVIYDIVFRGRPVYDQARQLFQEHPEEVFEVDIPAWSNGSAMSSRITDVETPKGVVHILRLTKADFEILEGIKNGTIDVFGEMEKVGDPVPEDEWDEDLPFS